MCISTLFTEIMPRFFKTFLKVNGFSRYFNGVHTLILYRKNITLLMGQSDSFLLRDKISFSLFYCFVK